MVFSASLEPCKWFGQLPDDLVRLWKWYRRWKRAAVAIVDAAAEAGVFAIEATVKVMTGTVVVAAILAATAAVRIAGDTAAMAAISGAAGANVADTAAVAI